jgi:hypothetical protein
VGPVSDEETSPTAEAAGVPDEPTVAGDGEVVADLGPARTDFDEIVDLPWDEGLPVAPGDDGETADPVDEAVPGGDEGDDAGIVQDEREEQDAVDEGGDDHDDLEVIDDGEDLGELYDDDPLGGRRNALPRRVDSWRSRSASGAIATAIAMGLQQVFEPERRRPAAVAEAPSDPYDDDDPITVDYVPDDAEGTTVHVKPWLLQKGDPT